MPRKSAHHPPPRVASAGVFVYAGLQAAPLPGRWMATHGDARMRRLSQKCVGVSHQVQERSFSAWLPSPLPETQADPRCPTPLIRDRPRNVQPLVLPPAARPLPFGASRAQIPRSHGPPERKIKATWLTLVAPQTRGGAAPKRLQPGPRAAREVEMPKEPESRRTPRETGGHAGARSAAESVRARLRANRC